MDRKIFNLQEVLKSFTETEINLGNKDKVLKGANYIADMVKVTLGAKGKTVLYRNRVGKPAITKDGVTVARHCKSVDGVEQMVIDIVKAASEETVKTSGDGTTTTIILTQFLINLGFYLMKNENVSYYELAETLDNFKNNVLSEINEHKFDIDTHYSKLLDVARISSNSKEIGDFVFDIIDDIGIYGSIELKKSSNPKDRIDKVKGIKFNKGFYAPQFVSDLNKMNWKAYDVNIVLYDDVVRTMNDLMPYINGAEGTPILFIVNDVEPTILQTLINNKIMNPSKFNVMIVEHDGFGDRKIEIMNDIAAMTGATVCNAENIGDMGHAEEILVDIDNTSILGGNADVELVDELINITKLILADEDGLYDLDDNEKMYYRRRLSTLNGGVAVIHVGGTTEVEMLEKYDRIEDAVEAVKASIERGVCIGGGYTFLQIYKRLYGEGNNKLYNNVLDVLKIPFVQICTNADINEEIIKRRMVEVMNENKSLDLIRNKMCTLDDYNVYDPAGVLQDSIANAVSAAKSILSIERVLGD